jgi:phosphoribosylaminoimidazolecarboxamide formyltransferase / IMP cyclohydrolase
VVRMEADYVPEMLEKRQVFGITLEQRRNDALISEELLNIIPTARKDLPNRVKLDLIVALITLKYTQSNSVCYARDGQAIGVGAGQQSRVHCTRLAGDKADLWHLRQHEMVLRLPFLPGLSRPERDNAVDLALSNRGRDLLKDDAWRRLFSSRPEILSEEDKRSYLDSLNNVSLASDAFFPFDDSILRAAESGVRYIAQPGGSLRDPEVIAACDRLGIVMAMTGLRLFHH